MRAVDTNVLVRLVARDDARQVAAAEDFISAGAWVSSLVLAEAVWVLRSVYRLDAKDQARAVEMLLNHRDLILHDSEAVSAALQLFRSRPTLGFSDCLMMELARQAGHMPFGTFDRNLSRTPGAHKL
jgi:predicted nucleic-acid-binding protein